MIDTRLAEELLNSVRGVLPGGLAVEIENNLRTVLQASLVRLNVVTREELEVQMQVLARTRQRLETLEQQVAELEKQLRK